MRALLAFIPAVLLASCHADTQPTAEQPAGEVPELLSGQVMGHQAVIGGEFFRIAAPEGIPATRAQGLVRDLLEICLVESGAATPEQAPEHARAVARCVNTYAMQQSLQYGSLEGIVQLTIPERETETGVMPAALFILPPPAAPTAP